MNYELLLYAETQLVQGKPCETNTYRSGHLSGPCTLTLPETLPYLTLPKPNIDFNF